jgi:hypothetical protein
MRRAALVAVLLLAGCGGGEDDLPRAVQTLERNLEAPRGVLHVVTDELRVVSEPNMPDLPPMGWADEVWLDLGGTGWRADRVTRDGGFQQVADEHGVRTYTRGGFVDLDEADGEGEDFLLRPWRAGIVVDPVRLVREGRLTVVGEATVRGRPAHIVVVEPDPSQNTRLYVARDDGDLLRILHRRERRGRLRTVVQDYVLFEVGTPRPRTLAGLIGREP